MIKDNLFNLTLDLIFKFDKSLRLKNLLQEENDNLIFEHYFWKEIFEAWMDTILRENKFNYLSDLNLKRYNFSLSFEIIDDQLITDLNKRIKINI